MVRILVRPMTPQNKSKLLLWVFQSDARRFCSRARLRCVTLLLPALLHGAFSRGHHSAGMRTATLSLVRQRILYRCATVRGWRATRRVASDRGDSAHESECPGTTPMTLPRCRSNQSMKPTAPLRNKFSVFATTPCRGLSLSR